MTATPENHPQVLEEVCAPVIADQAEKVDRGVVFPDQAITALKDVGLLGP